MQTKIHHALLAVSLSSIIAACGDDGPCLEGGDVCAGGETGEEDGGSPECAPFQEAEDEEGEPKVGSSFTCQGQGTGWLVTDVYGAGDPITTCVAYDTLEIPKEPTADDCAWRSMQTLTGAFDVPDPSACCTDEVSEDDIANTCVSDCGYAAVKVAIEAIRSSADNLQAPEGLPQGPFDVSKADLYAYADYLETPSVTSYCAKKVSASPGEVVSIGLGGGVSKETEFGHIKDAVLYLSCAPDPDEPFVAGSDIGICTSPANIPDEEAEQDNQGLIADGSVTVFGPDLNTSVDVEAATFEFRETLHRDLSVEFTLTRFDASLADASAGSFVLRDVEVALASSASGTLEGETVTFAAGALRFAVTATVEIDGEPLFEGAPTTAEYTNSSPATAIRSLDGSFAFVDASFRAGEYTAVLNTKPAPFVAIE